MDVEIDLVSPDKAEINHPRDQNGALQEHRSANIGAFLVAKRSVEPQDAECPVCRKKVSKLAIRLHVDACLQRSGQGEDVASGVERQAACTTEAATMTKTTPTAAPAPTIPTSTASPAKDPGSSRPATIASGSKKLKLKRSRQDHKSGGEANLKAERRSAAIDESGRLLREALAESLAVLGPLVPSPSSNHWFASLKESESRAFPGTPGEAPFRMGSTCRMQVATAKWPRRRHPDGYCSDDSLPSSGNSSDSGSALEIGNHPRLELHRLRRHAEDRMLITSRARIRARYSVITLLPFPDEPDEAGAIRRKHALLCADEVVDEAVDEVAEKVADEVNVESGSLLQSFSMEQASSGKRPKQASSAKKGSDKEGLIKAGLAKEVATQKMSTERKSAKEGPTKGVAVKSSTNGAEADSRSLSRPQSPWPLSNLAQPPSPVPTKAAQTVTAKSMVASNDAELPLGIPQQGWIRVLTEKGAKMRADVDMDEGKDLGTIPHGWIVHYEAAAMYVPLEEYRDVLAPVVRLLARVDGDQKGWVSLTGRNLGNQLPITEIVDSSPCPICNQEVSLIKLRFLFVAVVATF